MVTADMAQSLALQALVQLMDHDELRDRFLALCGLSPDDLRAGLSDASRQPEICFAVLDFFMQSEGDLVVVADLIDQKPEDIAAAWRALGGSPMMG